MGKKKKKASNAAASPRKAIRKKTGTRTKPGRREKLPEYAYREAQAALSKMTDLNRAQKEEVVSVICEVLCNGGSPPAIKDELKKRHLNVDVKNETIWNLFRWGAKEDLVRYKPKEDSDLTVRVSKRAVGKLDATVLRTAVGAHVAQEGAEKLLSMVKEKGGQEVHIGLGGGRTLRKLAREFSRLLQLESPRSCPAIAFHAMVGGVGYDFWADPHSFITFFQPEPPAPKLPVKIEFFRLPLPGVCEKSTFDSLRTTNFFKDVYDAAEKLDIIVTSGGSFDDVHSTLHRYVSTIEKSAIPKKLWPSKQPLEKSGVVGDLLWQPLTKDGPADLHEDLRATSLMTLDEMASFVRKENQVLLVLAACDECHQPKGRLLDAILQLKNPLISHVVTDTPTAREVASE